MHDAKIFDAIINIGYFNPLTVYREFPIIIENRFKEISVEYFQEEKYKENLWSGYKTMFIPEHLLESIYSNPACNVLQVDTNEYIVNDFNIGKENDIEVLTIK